MNRIIVPFAIVASLAAVSPVLAQAATEYVSYYDLDLRSAQGRQMLAGRVKGAVQRVCDDKGPLTSEVLDCRLEARLEARRQMRAVFSNVAQNRLVLSKLEPGHAADLSYRVR